MTITCIIPAFNEAARIAAVLTAVTDHPMIDQIIVVDDGSWDATSKVVRGIAGVHLITLPQNIGKTAALAVAIGQASGDHLLLVDADLIGLTPSDLTALIEPVVLAILKNTESKDDVVVLIEPVTELIPLLTKS